MKVIAGVDLGGTAINYTIIDEQEKFLLEGLCEYPALSTQGPDVCLAQIEKGLEIAAAKAGVQLDNVVAVGLDTPGPASATGVLSARGSTNFVHPDWSGFDIRQKLEVRLGRPVTYLNDGNAGALWGHFSIFGADSEHTSVTTVIGTGLGGGVIIDGNVVKGRMGFGGELGHVLIPYQSIAGTEGMKPPCKATPFMAAAIPCASPWDGAVLRSDDQHLRSGRVDDRRRRAGDGARVSEMVPRRDAQGHAAPA